MFSKSLQTKSKVFSEFQVLKISFLQNKIIKRTKLVKSQLKIAKNDNDTE